MKTILSLLVLGFAFTASAQIPAPSDLPSPKRPAPGVPRGERDPRPTGTIAPIIDPDAKPIQREAVLRNDSLVKVNVTYQGYAPHIPWQKESPGQRRGLGVILDGDRVLVTGQLVSDATYIELELADTGAKLPAKVIAVDYEANLAVLVSAVVESRTKTFFKDLKPMLIDTKARIGDNLNVWQLGRVGDLIVTNLKLSKVLTSQYVVEGSKFLIYEGQGIVRSEGNSFTVPIVKGGRLAGLLLNYDSKNQLTTVLPGPIIEHFLKDLADGKNDGFPSLGIEFHPTMDEQFREYLGLKTEQGGMFVSAVSKGGSADALGIEKGDIVLALNGFAIDARGDYEDPDYGRLSMSHIVRGRAYVGDEMEVKVLREGKEKILKGKLKRKSPDDYLVRPYLFDRGPNYFVAGGLVFQELTRPYLNAYGDRGGAPLARLQWVVNHPEDFEKSGRRRLVFLSGALPTPSTQGYDRVNWLIVNKVNGMAINDLHDLETAFKQPKDGIHLIELEDSPKRLYLDAIQMERDNLALLGGAYRIGELKRIE